MMQEYHRREQPQTGSVMKSTEWTIVRNGADGDLPCGNGMQARHGRPPTGRGEVDMLLSFTLARTFSVTSSKCPVNRKTVRSRCQPAMA